MPTVTTFPQGTPIWVDLQSTDPQGAAEFYAGLFGWQTQQPTAETGSYWMAFLNGAPVAAIGGLPPAMADQGAGPTWTTYLAVDDADATAELVPDAGGTVLLPPGDLGNGVRLLIAADPSGAVIGFWQQGSGAEGAWLRGDPGSVSWFELLSDQFETAVPFYQRVLGLTASRMPMGDGDYTLLTVGESSIAGAYGALEQGTPSHWRVYFEVADIDDAVARVSELGGAVSGEIQSAEGVGRWASVSDPQGGGFSLIQST